jgi:hypothetical protein
MPTDPTSKSILNFVLPGQLNVAPMIDHGDNDDADGEITVLMPIDASLLSLVPTKIIHTGKTVLNASTPRDFSNPTSPASYVVEAGNGSTKTYMVRITHPVLPPLTAGSHEGYVVTTVGSIYYGNQYSPFDNNLDTVLCYHNAGTFTITWESGAQAVNRIRVILTMRCNVRVAFRTSPDTWVEVVPTTPHDPGEFVQTIPQSMNVTGVMVTVSQAVKDWRPRVAEFIIE